MIGEFRNFNWTPLGWGFAVVAVLILLFVLFGG